MPDGANVLIDLSNTNWVDLDNVEIINNFVDGAERRGIDARVRGDFRRTHGRPDPRAASGSALRMKVYRQLLLSNQAWASELKEENQAFFERLTAGQRPHFLWIGCADSRVGPEQMTMTPPGGLFTHRNVANLVDAADDNLMAVVEYAVGRAEGRGRAAVRPLWVWRRAGGARRVGRAGDDDGRGRPLACAMWARWPPTTRTSSRALPEEERAARLVELNVRDQLIRLARVSVVAEARAAGTAVAATAGSMTCARD